MSPTRAVSWLLTKILRNGGWHISCLVVLVNVRESRTYKSQIQLREGNVSDKTVTLDRRITGNAVCVPCSGCQRLVFDQVVHSDGEGGVVERRFHGALFRLHVGSFHVSAVVRGCPSTGRGA